MIYSKTIRNLADDIVSHYSTFDKFDNMYYLSIDNIPDFDLHELSSFLMLENTDLASEATGYDNPAYLEKMLPAQIKYLSNSTNKDEEIEFIRCWKEGVTDYLKDLMNELLQDAVERMNKEFNHSRHSYAIERSLWI